MHLIVAFAACLLPYSVFAHSRSHEDIEQAWRPAYLSRATGDIRRRDAVKATHTWPVKVLSIGNNTGSYQGYGGQPYFHHGLDIRADSGGEVRALVGGKVINIENYEPGQAAYWEVAILDAEGFIWQYHHVDRNTIPSDIVAAHKNGTPISTGAKIGEVFYWPVVSEGERYHHIHLNVIGKDQEYLNAFNFLERLEDNASPQIVEIGLLQNGNKISGDTVKGDYSIFAHVTDLVLSEKFLLPPHSLYFEIDGGFPTVFWSFDTLPGGSSNTKFVDQFYVAKMVCGNYSCRRPIVDLGFTTDGKRKFPSTPGEHHIRVVAKDQNFNSTSKEFSWRVL